MAYLPRTSPFNLDTLSELPCRKYSSARSVCVVRSFVFSGFALHEGRLLFITAPRCKAAGLAFIGAKRRALAEEADGSGAGFSQEGHLGLQG